MLNLQARTLRRARSGAGEDSTSGAMRGIWGRRAEPWLGGGGPGVGGQIRAGARTRCRRTGRKTRTSRACRPDRSHLLPAPYRPVGASPCAKSALYACCQPKTRCQSKRHAPQPTRTLPEVPVDRARLLSAPARRRERSVRNFCAAHSGRHSRTKSSWTGRTPLRCSAACRRQVALGRRPADPLCGRRLSPAYRPPATSHVSVGRRSRRLTSGGCFHFASLQREPFRLRAGPQYVSSAPESSRERMTRHLLTGHRPRWSKRLRYDRDRL